MVVIDYQAPQSLGEAIKLLSECTDKPARVLAGGTDLALYCDFIITADDANIGFPPLRNMGSPPNHLWLYNCGPQWTKRMLLTGDLMSGADAAKIGFAMKSVPPEHLEAEVEGLADRLALVDNALLAANKRIVNLGLELMGAGTLQRRPVVEGVWVRSPDIERRGPRGPRLCEPGHDQWHETRSQRIVVQKLLQGSAQHV